MITPDDVVQAAREWIGTPYIHQGRAKGAGVDCLGLPVGVMRGLGVDTPDRDGYGLDPTGELMPGLDGELHRIELQPGALILFRIRRQPQHVAIATDIGMIHSYMGSKKVVETSIDKWWRDRLICAYAMPGVNYGE